MKGKDKKIQFVSMFFAVAFITVGCQNLMFSGTYNYEEFSKPVSSTGVTFESGTITFRQASKFTLSQDSTSLEEPSDNYFLAGSDGQLSITGQKAGSKAFFAPEADLIVTNSLLAVPGNNGLGWAIKDSTTPRFINGRYEIQALRFINIASSEEAQLLNGSIHFNWLDGTFFSNLSNDSGDEFNDDGVFELIDNGTITWTDDSLGGVTFVGNISESGYYFLAKAECSNLLAQYHYTLCAVKEHTTENHDILGRYNIIQMEVGRNGEDPSISSAKLTLDSTSFTYEIGPLFTASGTYSYIGGASYLFIDDYGDTINLLFSNEDKSIGVTTISDPDFILFGFAIRILEQS